MAFPTSKKKQQHVLGFDTFHRSFITIVRLSLSIWYPEAELTFSFLKEKVLLTQPDPCLHVIVEVEIGVVAVLFQHTGKLRLYAVLSARQ